MVMEGSISLLPSEAPASLGSSTQKIIYLGKMCLEVFTVLVQAWNWDTSLCSLDWKDVNYNFKGC
jgi:hypothetical protein